MKKTLLFLVSWMLLTYCICQTKKFEEFTKNFVSQYQSFNIPGLQLSYVENLQNIKSKDGVQRQQSFFSSVKKELAGFNRNQLSETEKDDYDLIAYETNLNLQRLALELQWTSETHEQVPATGLYTLPHGKEWYAYFLKRWVGADVTPDEIYQFGLREVERVKRNIESIRLKAGMSEADFYKHLNDDSFFLKDQHTVEQAFERTKQIVLKNLHNVFNVQNIPDLKIEKGTNQALVQTPGYYTNNTFYYNYFDKPYNKRQVDWLFIHEGIPGHHYQGSIARQIFQTDVHQLFYYLGFSEGWAAYAEELGKDIGLYQTIYDELGKWEWDIVRSVRVPLDVALNYYGWTDEQALAFWKKNIPNQDDIAMREINRMRRWPAQVVTYKYGADQIMQWRNELMKKEKQNFDIRAFHDRVLNKGSLPFFMVKRNVLGT